ncbi:hypothetical protein ACFYZV_38640, partial [Streptomyces phaeofaciens]|uniref:hypothetical protein n=1 Tax=Streptomyces phaeofaciens TaxID=68254 RepID=UPI0036A338A3
MPEFDPKELDYELPRESANVVNVERATGESQKPQGKSRRQGIGSRKRSDRVGIAGKETRERDPESTEEIGSRKDLIESETQDRR